MAYSEKFTCDICGVERGATNHWLLARGVNQEHKSLIIIPFTIYEARPSVAVPRKILCGASCVSKWVSENLSSLYPPAVQPPVVESARPVKKLKKKKKRWRSND